MSLALPWLGHAPDAPFPPAKSAMRDPNGLLAAGGDLTAARLLNAYSHGIFPWFSEGEPLLWWSPDPRMVFHTDGVRLSSKFRRQLRSSPWTLRADTSFDAVIKACASTPRPGQRGTWITSPMQTAYIELHRQGHAHSVEVFDGDALVGGIYGVSIGQMFFGESMFSGVSGGSKVALAGIAHFLRRQGWPLIDAQVENDHLKSLGAVAIPRSEFLDIVQQQVALPVPAGDWQARFGALAARDLANPD